MGRLHGARSQGIAKLDYRRREGEGRKPSSRREEVGRRGEGVANDGVGDVESRMERLCYIFEDVGEIPGLFVVSTFIDGKRWYTPAQMTGNVRSDSE